MNASRIAIIDSGGANIASLLYAFDRLQAAATLTTDADLIRSAECVVLPGVGAARDAMQRLRDHKLIDIIRGLKQPVLGICLGMQLLADASEEEDVECLGIIPGTAAKLPATTRCPVPNMGWCPITKRARHRLLDDLVDGSYFYFLHSYALPVSAYTLAEAQHAAPFAAMVGHNNFVAAQFHPERSSVAGSRLLQNFLELGA
ncbi:MAG: imidazole glycerol phosphate synthase subunit HisH [Gammaproteobacteria bacterium]|nr:imidazole glycerol phosphate synthase subunit HisH [Gammaproteobacteria bacterium]